MSTYTVQYGGKAGQTYKLVESNDLIAVRARSRNLVFATAPGEGAALSDDALAILGHFELETQYFNAGVAILRTRTTRQAKSIRDQARAVLKSEPDVRFAGRVLVDPQSKAPVLYTENLFVKFDDEAKAATCRQLIKKYGLTIKSPVDYVRNGYFLGAPEGIGLEVFDVAQRLLQEEAVEYCHPELIRRRRDRAAFPNQWHLRKTTIGGRVIDQSANVEAAWALSQGEGVTIAIIDDGVDIDHEEFGSAGKIVAPRDVTRRTDDPRPGNSDNHGTACAGVACANGMFGASGVAPKARLMPIRLTSGLGSQHEADAFVWAAQHGADVISCSWGPADGQWWNPNDPLHKQVVPLPDSTRLAMDYAVRNGRNGKGCVILFAAGNGNESVDNDGYASYDKVIAVAACNDMGTRAAYSDYGKAIWCAFPSNHGHPSLTPGIWTTDRTGAPGYNPGQTSRGDAQGNYTNSFGGTSSACPGVAGVAALILARNPDLRWDEVREIIKNSCDKIDAANGNYDANGHSPWYGFGRVNARKAVELAAPPQPQPVVIVSVKQDVPIPDLKSAKLSATVAETRPLKGLKVWVDIEHTYRGDLVVTLKPPAASGIGDIVLHNRQGGAANHIKQTYDAANTPALASVAGKSPSGEWTLLVADKARYDVGKIREFKLEMIFA
ncbi:MAG: peptidase S8 [Chloroflexi bacterium]|nr:MAG: peptidase S8 [Chloroflexota bacterium]